jgi:hypothetical protein
VAGLEDKVSLPLDGLGGQAAGDVGLAPQLSRRGGLEEDRQGYHPPGQISCSGIYRQSYYLAGQVSKGRPNV